MRKVSVCVWMVAIFLVGCAHRGAVRVQCEGPLRPINRPISLKDAPVTIAPASPESTNKPGTAP
jgi:hypothetical protein